MNVARVLPELYQRSVRIIADAVFGLPDNADTGYFQIPVMRIQIVCKIISAPCLYTVIGLKREEPVRFHNKTVGRWIVLALDVYKRQGQRLRQRLPYRYHVRERAAGYP